VKSASEGVALFDVYYLESAAEASFYGNPLMEKLGYKIYRDTDGDGAYKAVLAYASIDVNQLDQKYKKFMEYEQND
jgi:hypothetical protein